MLVLYRLVYIVTYGSYLGVNAIPRPSTFENRFKIKKPVTCPIQKKKMVG